MRISKMTLINFRNYPYQEVEFHPSFNLFYGDNAQGKTNLLEAVYLASRGHSFKSISDRGLIRFGEKSAYVRAEMERRGRKKTVEVKLSMVDPKRVRINEVEVESLREMEEQFEVVLFAPEDLQLIKGGPAERRGFLDELLETLDPLYKEEWRSCQRVIFQRNQLLKSAPSHWFDRQLDVLDQQLIQASLPVFKKRAAISQELGKEAGDYQLLLTEGREELKMAYQTRLFEERESRPEDFSPDHFSSVMEQQLKEGRERDKEYRNTALGPHKDELAIFIGGLYSRSYASQGQSRTAALACKLAQMKLIEKYRGLSPVLLLDDVFSELDGRRSLALMEAIEGCQAMVTTNEPGELRGIGKGAFYRVDRGKIFPDEGEWRKESYGN